MFGYRKKLLAKAIASEIDLDTALIANELSDMSDAQLDTLEDKYEYQIAALLSTEPSPQQKLQLLAA